MSRTKISSAFHFPKIFSWKEMRSKERKEGIKKERMKERIMIDRSFVSQKEGKKKKKNYALKEIHSQSEI